MADNAFYPGYLPDAADGSPSYPGYYPGQKLPRIQKNIKPLKGFDFTMDHLLEEIDSLELELTNHGGYLPGWVKDRLIDDFKQQFKATVKGSEGFIDVEQLDEYDANSLPGAFGFAVNLNPVDWAKDPGKMAKKTLDGLRKAMVNWGDVETRVKENIWRQVIEETPDYTAVVGAENFKGTAPMAEATAGAITRRMTTTGKKYGLTSGIALVSHGAGTRTSKGVESTYELEVDSSGAFVLDPATGKTKFKTDPKTGDYIKNVYTTVEDELADVGSKVVAFERFSSFAPKRDDKFDEFESAVFKAIDKELSYDPTVKTILDDPANSALKAEFEAFQAKKNIAAGMEIIGKGYGGKGGLKAGLQKMILEGSTEGLIKYELDSAGNPVVDAATGKFKLAMKNGAPERDLFRSYSENIQSTIDDIDKMFLGATPDLKGKMDPKDFEAMQKRMVVYRKHLEEMKTKVDG
ncbi:hypothetical protein GYA27_03335, partial [candidate division WWE3 bacterium]|nr:hypothetical protein [candidate division WWE3 bacterium]